MHRHARPGALLIIFVLALLAGAASLAGPATQHLTGAAPNAVGLVNVALHPDDDEVARAPAPATQHLTAPTLIGLAAGAAQPPTTGPASGGVHPRHHGPVAQETGTRQDRAPPAITDR